MVKKRKLQKKIRSLENNYKQSIINYYRGPLRKQDDAMFKTILKIPDNWDEFEKKMSISLSDNEKKQLSYKKKSYAWKIQFESQFIEHFINIENTLISCLTYRELEDDQIEDAKESISSILNNADRNIINFKDLLLLFAKRAISDLYYLMAAYHKYYNKKNFNFDTDFENFFNDLTSFFDEYKFIIKELNNFKQNSKEIETYFTLNKKSIGYKIIDDKINDFFSKDDSYKIKYIYDLKKLITTAFLFKKKLKSGYEFINFYFNGQDGKLFRYNYILNSLSQKLAKKNTSRDIVDGFNEILKNFTHVKKAYETFGLKDFGPDELPYSELINFLYKGSRLIESYHLRKSQYEELDKFRSTILHYVEKEYFNLNPRFTRT